MSDNQRTEVKWVIRVQGTQLSTIEPGETVEIGRKPIRPLPQGDVRRVEILDDTRSMSKHHARFTVNLDGSAVLKDLNSTNGTYIVRTAKELLRLPADNDFVLPEDLMHIQFGDVPVDFVKYVDEEQETSTPQVANLFDYVVDNAVNEPNTELSVDDILNLRAGEPTDIFSQSSVVQRARELKDAEQQSFVPFVQPIDPLHIDDDDDQEGTSPRDLFSDAKDIAQGKLEQPDDTDEEFVRERRGPKHADPHSKEFVDVEELAFRHVPVVDTPPQSEPIVAPVEETPIQEETPETPEVVDIETSQESTPVDSDIQEPSEDEDALYRQPNQEVEQETTVFEPGSVFTRLSNEEHNAHDDVIEVEGFTSHQAQKSEDFTEQFEMAKYSQLLPFLAMNPSLYDDLYAWLAAQGNDDIDKALEDNPGYEEYRKAVGK